MTELNIPKFFDQVEEKQYLLTEEFPEVMQINVGSLCNITCSHCHVDGGPTRKNNMVRETFEQIIEAFKVGKYKTMDITGGAPEMNPNFRWFLKEISQHAKTIIVRTNLIILDVPAYRDIPELYRDLKVQVVASLPYYNEKVVAKQRGKGVFPKSIEVLRRLNELGYGKEEDLILNLVYNPNGAFLPPKQEALEKTYKKKLYDNFEIVFNNLFAITNNPIGRFSEFLHREDLYEGYINKLYKAYNPATLSGLMCRNMISVGPDGSLYDCDFNYIEKLKISGEVNHVRQLVDNHTGVRRIVTGMHCYGCTAGAGSS
ncbi:arsenosugar biosynthesis radical SAM (seleno)protein ArsS [uncultured Gemella sp.]|uniref:arsenosugar biosynthesis radical SAM (seleno)protein ArsS n=1 Tax=uncultured Gemella sp. TaxID=254352 RepID=UPI0026325882|nr:arsenosugar biosynthesis radical SAM (seleno)protein ArsS [uncultured Gemella sp.]